MKRKTFIIKVLPAPITHQPFIIKVLAPKKTSPLLIQEILYKRRSWIQKRQDYLNKCIFLTKPQNYVNDEKLLYSGNEYSIQLHQAKHESIELTDNQIIINLKNPENYKRRAALVKSWYSQRAKDDFGAQLSKYLPLLNGMHNKNVFSKQRFMKSLWGSCSNNGRILLNTHLIKTPRVCQDFVIMHELCHLAVLNHSRKYYELLEKMMPDWKARQSMLKMYTCNYW